METEKEQMETEERGGEGAGMCRVYLIAINDSSMSRFRTRRVVRVLTRFETFESVTLFTPVLSRTTFRLYLLSTIEA